MKAEPVDVGRAGAPEDSYRELIEGVPVVVYESEPGVQGAWRYISPQIETLLGYSAEDWVADPDLW